MMLNNMLEKIPEYAKDIKLNMSSIINNHSGLTDTQFWGSALASALATKNKILSEAIKTEKPEIFNDNVLFGVNAAFTMMSMTNIYYRFIHLSENSKYNTMSTGLRMNIMRAPNVDVIDFEVFSLAVSIVNGCGMCIASHEKQLIKHGLTEENIQLIAKVAAIIHSLASIELLP